MAKDIRNERALMASQLVHDLKTFLTVIHCTGQMIEEQSACGTAHHFARQIIKSCESLDRLVEEILNLSQIELGNFPLRLHSVPVIAELSNIVQAYKLHASRKGLALSLRFEGEIPELVRTDGLRLNQIIANLMGNAIRYTVVGKVEIVCSYREGLLKIAITDTGVGISSAEQKQLFEPFRRLKNRREHPESHGLGLALSRKLAALLGGDVTLLRSKPGEGSTFVMTILAPPIESSMRIRSQYVDVYPATK